MRHAGRDDPLPVSIVNPHRPDRVELRCKKRRPKEYDLMSQPPGRFAPAAQAKAWGAKRTKREDRGKVSQASALSGGHDDASRPFRQRLSRRADREACGIPARS